TASLTAYVFPDFAVFCHRKEHSCVSNGAS
ncbi:MAG: hypothetical protein ACI9JU_002256, partial [Pseudohongiellaceae bacterium]